MLKPAVIVLVLLAALCLACTQGPRQPPIITPSAGVVFVPLVQFRPPVVQVGGDVEITGVGFALRTALRGYIAGPSTNEFRTAFAAATTDSDGSFRVTVKLDPGLAPGPYRVTFTNADGSSMNGETTLVIAP